MAARRGEREAPLSSGPKLLPASRAGGFLFDGASKLMVTPNREAPPLAGAQDNDMPTPFPSADDGGVPA